jgi:hypothetical protein
MPFVDFTEAMHFIQQQLQDLTLQAVPTTDPQFQEKLLKESFRLWDDFTKSYTEMVLSTIGQTMERSQEMQEQVGETIARAFRMWMPPAFRNVEDAHASDLNGLVSDLAAQVAALNEKISALEAHKEN